MRRLSGRSRVDRLLYVEDQNDGKVIVRPAGLLGKLVPPVELDPHGEMARQSSRR